MSRSVRTVGCRLFGVGVDGILMEEMVCDAGCRLVCLLPVL